MYGSVIVSISFLTAACVTGIPAWRRSLFLQNSSRRRSCVLSAAAKLHQSQRNWFQAKAAPEGLSPAACAPGQEVTEDLPCGTVLQACVLRDLIVSSSSWWMTSFASFNVIVGSSTPPPFCSVHPCLAASFKALKLLAVALKSSNFGG